MALGHRILVPLDGSAFAERALPLATAIARHSQGVVHLLNASAPWPAHEVPPDAAGMFMEAETALRQHLEDYVAERARDLEEAGVTAEAELRQGLVDLEILHACAERVCDLIIMATHGRGGLDRLWAGSVADRVFRHAEVPVLLVSAAGRAGLPGSEIDADPAARPPAPAATPNVRTVIIPLDGSAFSEHALVPATALGEAFAADYILFRAVAPPRAVPLPALQAAARVETELLERERATARRELEATAARMRAAGFTVTVMVEENDDPIPGLLRLAGGTPDSVIAMTTHGRGGLRRAVIGSVADRVVRACRRPILLIRPDLRRRDPASRSGTNTANHPGSRRPISAQGGRHEDRDDFHPLHPRPAERLRRDRAGHS